MNKDLLKKLRKSVIRVYGYSLIVNVIIALICSDPNILHISFTSILIGVIIELIVDDK